MNHPPHQRPPLNLRRSWAAIAPLVLLSLVLALVLYIPRDQPGDAPEARNPSTSIGHAPGTALEVTATQSKSAGPATNAPVVAPPALEAAKDESHFTERTLPVVAWAAAGRPFQIRLGKEKPMLLRVRPARVTAPEFQVGLGPGASMPASVRAFKGSISDAEGERRNAQMAVVNDAVSLYLSLDDGDYRVSTDPETGGLVARKLLPPEGEDGNTECDIDHHGLATVTLPPGLPGTTGEPIPVELTQTTEGGTFAQAEGIIEESRVDHPQFRLGPKYDASLVDMLLLFVLDKYTTGNNPGAYSSKAADFLALAATVGDVYERQLGLRPLLQEIILNPDEASVTDPGQSLTEFSSWLSSNRPRGSFSWGHAARFGLVDGSPSGVVGRAYVGAYGSASGISENEPQYSYALLGHEMGHNVGSSHTNGGIMNSSLRTSEENFFQPVATNTAVTGAYQIYNSTRLAARTYGEAPLRHAAEIPFGTDDTLNAGPGPLTFDPLANDASSVLLGANNSQLTLVEVGSVFPKEAGSAEVVGQQITFTPLAGYSGQAWFTYTLKGNVGNGGAGWMHAADVIINVNGSSSAPGTQPPLNTTEDFILTELSDPIRLNVLLNDEGAGRLWVGEVDVLLDPDGADQNYFGTSLSLVDAQLITGNGSLSIEKRFTNRDGSPSQDNNGYLVYTPGSPELAVVVIQYTARDANGGTQTQTVRLSTPPLLQTTISKTLLREPQGEQVNVTFDRSSAPSLSTPETVTFGLTGTASAGPFGADYVVVGAKSFDPANGIGVVEIPPGTTQAEIVVLAVQDNISEPVEYLRLEVLGASSLTLSQTSVFDLEIIDTSAPILSENFDSFKTGSKTNPINGWENGPDGQFDWQADASGTPTSNTGPSRDHTSGNGRYMYTEASSQHLSRRADLLSPALNLAGESGATLTFFYNMYGNAMGNLHVDVYNGASWTEDVFLVSGQQHTNGNTWTEANISLSGFLADGVRIRFRGIVGSNFRSDMAIDDVRVEASGSSAPVAPVILASPAGSSPKLGDTVYLAVAAVGSPVPTYQWRRNGLDLPGATSPAYQITSFNAGDAGSYECLVSNSGGSVLSASALLVIPSGIDYDSWLEGFPEVSGASSDPLSDFDLDGLSEIQEFAHGLRPDVANTSGHPSIAEVTDSSNGKTYLHLTYRRRSGGAGTTGVNYTADGLVYTIECNTGLNPAAWVALGSGQSLAIGTPVDNGDGTETVTVRVLPAIEDSSGKMFVHLKIRESN